MDIVLCIITAFGTDSTLALRLESYRFTIEILKSEENVVDAPSRHHRKSLRGGSKGIRLVHRRTPAKLLFLWKRKSPTHETGEWTDPEIKEYAKIRGELQQHGWMIVRPERVVLPAALQGLDVNIAHLSHAGASSMKRHLRAHFWWPTLDRDVDNKRRGCENCARMEREGPPIPLTPTEIPIWPWTYLAIDFYSKEQPVAFKVVVLQDYTSKYVKAVFVKSTDGAETIRFREKAFEDLWIPKKLISDNGPPFQSKEFADYCAYRKIQLIHSAPGHPVVNGLIKRFMRNIRRTMIGAIIEGAGTRKELENALECAVHQYNRRPHSMTQASPFKLLFKRESKEIFPVLQEMEGDEEVAQRVKEAMEKGKAYTDKRQYAKPCDIKVGDEVALFNFGYSGLEPPWKDGWFKVTRKEGADVFVDVNGKEFRRNLLHVKKSPFAKTQNISSKQGEGEMGKI